MDVATLDRALINHDFPLLPYTFPVYQLLNIMSVQFLQAKTVL